MTDFPALLRNQRWFGAKSRHITSVEILDSAVLTGTTTLLNLITNNYAEGLGETYFVPVLKDSDALLDDATCLSILGLIENESRIPTQHGNIQGCRSSGFPNAAPNLSAIRRVKTEQSNSSIIFGDRLILKLFRRQQPGENPDCELSRYLTEHTQFRAIPPFAGSLEYRRQGSEPYTLAILQGLVPNLGDGLNWTLEQIRAGHPVSEAFAKLGRRTAQMHAALATFQPQPIEHADLLSLADDMSHHAKQSLARLDRELPGHEILDCFDRLKTLKPSSLRIRIHGDYHLGQILRVPDDFVILDFEGEPTKSLTERRAKHCPLKDVAGMLRSFSYVSYIGIPDETTRHNWEVSTCAAFLDAYTQEAGNATFLPADPQAFNTLLKAYVLDKAFYELNYEIDNRPDWVRIPLSAILASQHGEDLP